MELIKFTGNASSFRQLLLSVCVRVYMINLVSGRKLHTCEYKKLLTFESQQNKFWTHIQNETKIHKSCCHVQCIQFN